MEDIVLKIQQGQNELYSELWEAVRDLISWSANRFYTKITVSGSAPGGVEREDLIQTGFIALSRAVNAYDPEKGSFITLLVYHIKTAFCDAIGRSRKRFHDPLNYAVSLDVPVSEDDPDGLSKLDFVPDPHDHFAGVEDAVFREELREALEKALDSIPPREALAIRSEFWEGCKLQETAEKMDVSPQMVRQLKENGFRHIRQSSAGKQLERFLDDETSFYKGVGLVSFRQTNSSGIEKKVIYREKMREKFEKRMLEIEQRKISAVL